MAHYLDPKNDLTFKRIFGEHLVYALNLVNEIFEPKMDEFYHHYKMKSSL